MRSLVKAWRKVPRDLIIASFQRTSFRTDDCFLEIHCSAWEELKTGVSFRKFVTFDDNLSVSASRKRQRSTGNSHGYNLRNRKIIRLVDDRFDSAIERHENSINYHSKENEKLKKIFMEKEIDWKSSGKSSLKRSREKARLDENKEANGTKSNDESTPKNKKHIVSTSTKFPKVIDNQIIKSTAQSFEIEEIHPMRAVVSDELIASGTNTICDNELAKTTNKNGSENGQVASSERLIESPSKVENTNSSEVTSQQVSNDTSLADLNTKEPDAEAISRATARDAMGSINENNDRSFQNSLKRKRSPSASTEGTADNSSDGEPQRKRSKSDYNWTKQYETTFVFGSPDSARAVSTVSVDTLSDNDVRQPRRRRSCETERSIFTIRPRKD